MQPKISHRRLHGVLKLLAAFLQERVHPVPATGMRWYNFLYVAAFQRRHISKRRSFWMTQNPTIYSCEEDEIDLFELVEALWRRKKTILLVAALFVAIGLAYALLAPRQYEARTTLLILPPISTEMTGDQKENSPSVFAPDIYTELARARDIIQQAVSAAYPSGEQPSIEDVLNTLKTSVNKSSEDRGSASQALTLSVSLRGSEPEKLSTLLSAWSKAFIERNTQLLANRTAQSLEYVTEAFRVTGGDLAKAEDNLTAFKKDNPTGLFDTKLETLQKYYGIALQEHSLKSAALIAIDAEVATLRALRAAQPERVALNKGMSDDALWGALVSRPEMAAKAENLDIKSEMLNPLYEEVVSKLQEKESEAAGLRASVAYLQDRIGQLEEEYQTLRVKQAETATQQARLARERDTLNEAYVSLAKQH
ncbi:MAG TPA: hypothetical protein DIC53_00545, partial [Synergistaceae bacterium]|nr:hypothetical protein [Synergistaceae bacterium]